MRSCIFVTIAGSYKWIHANVNISLWIGIFWGFIDAILRRQNGVLYLIKDAHGFVVHCFVSFGLWLQLLVDLCDIFTHIHQVWFTSTVTNVGISMCLWYNIGRLWVQKTISQIPQCFGQISHIAWFCNINMHRCTCLLQNGALWDMGLMHYGICATGPPFTNMV